MDMTVTSDQAGNLAAQFIRQHGSAAWQAVTYEDGVLHVPDEIAAQVQALDPDLEPVPDEVTMFQARAVLIQSGLIGQVEAALEADTSQQGAINRAAWEHSNRIRRNHPLIMGLGQVLGLTDSQIDDMFRLAETID